MRKLLILLIKSFILIAGILILLIASFFMYSTINDFTPNKEQIEFTNLESPLAVTDTINLMTWNIGFLGLGEQMDFFYDGGNNVITTSEDYIKNQEFIKGFFNSQDKTDFWLFQEVDIYSKRSYFKDQREIFKSDKLFNHFFSQNYKVSFVPVPFYQPMGKVNSGLYTISSFQPTEVITRYFDGNYSWPTKLFMFDRCYSVLKFKTNYIGDLILINTHNSAFDDGNLRVSQLNELISYARNEYLNGNYIIIGGDWNMNPPGFISADIKNYLSIINPHQISDTIITNKWQWVYDSTIPTNRSLDESFDPETTETTTIDFYLLSPNIKPLIVKTLDLGFMSSDHNPVYVKLALQPDLTE